MTCPLIFSAQRYLTWEAFTDLLPPQHFLFLVPALFFFITLKTTWFICLSIYHQFSSVQSLSRVWLFVIPMDCSTPGLPIHCQLLEFTQTHVHWVSNANHLILCCPLLLPPSVFPSIMVFSNELVLLIRWPKYWSFSFSISPSNEYSGLISFSMDWLDLFAVQETLKSLLQHHSSKASILQRSAFFTVQLSHSYMTTGKTIALTRQTIVGKAMSLLFNMLSRLVITFFPRIIF